LISKEEKYWEAMKLFIAGRKDKLNIKNSKYFFEQIDRDIYLQPGNFKVDLEYRNVTIDKIINLSLRTDSFQLIDFNTKVSIMKKNLGKLDFFPGEFSKDGFKIYDQTFEYPKEDLTIKEFFETIFEKESNSILILEELYISNSSLNIVFEGFIVKKISYSDLIVEIINIQNKSFLLIYNDEFNISKKINKSTVLTFYMGLKSKTLKEIF
jgi:hypothetical protein